MHPLPSQEHLDYLVGSELTQITIDPYQVRFYLSGLDVATGITVSSPFHYREGDTEDRFEPDSGCRGQGPVKFHALLMQKISALEVTPAGDRLTLQFVVAKPCQSYRRLTDLMSLAPSPIGTDGCGFSSS